MPESFQPLSRLWPIESNSYWTFGVTFSTIEVKTPLVADLSLTNERILVSLSDGREISVPLTWFPRLLHATACERTDFRLVGDGSGINWPQLDEDISVRNLIDERPSAESQKSLQRWLAARKTGDHKD